MQHLRRIARAGGLARVRLHGNPGTSAGRRLGGLHAYAINKQLNNRFNNLKIIPRVRHSKSLAELLGILAGDGHLSKYQVTVTTNSETDYVHARFVQKMFRKIFDVTPSIKLRSGTRALTVCLSSKAACNLLYKFGMPYGHKIKNIRKIPDWIQNNSRYRIAFIRGLFDTDGCFYIDKHVIKSKLYENPGMNFRNYSLPLLFFFESVLTNLNLFPTTTSKYSVVLRKEKNIVKYFREVGSSNPKHLKKFYQYFKAKYGRVPKRS